MADALVSLVGVPKYVQIREALRAAVQTGAFVPGKPIPPEKELAARYHVSRMTVRHAMDGLIDEGLFYRRHGVGTFVSGLRIPRDYSRLISSFEMVSETGLQPGTRILSVQALPASLEVANALHLQEGEPAIRFERLRLASGQPIAILCSYVPQKLCPPTVLEDLQCHDSLIALLEEYGFRLGRAIQTLQVRLADHAEAELLGIEEGDPLVCVERTTFADNGVAIDYVQAYNRADAFNCTMVLSR